MGKTYKLTADKIAEAFLEALDKALICSNDDYIIFDSKAIRKTLKEALKRKKDEA